MDFVSLIIKYVTLRDTYGSRHKNHSVSDFGSNWGFEFKPQLESDFDDAKLSTLKLGVLVSLKVKAVPNSICKFLVQLLTPILFTVLFTIANKYDYQHKFTSFISTIKNSIEMYSGLPIPRNESKISFYLNSRTISENNFVGCWLNFCYCDVINQLIFTWCYENA